MSQFYGYRVILLLIISLLTFTAAVGINFLQSVPQSTKGEVVSTSSALTTTTNLDKIRQLQIQLQRNPDDTTIQSSLGLALLQQARISGDSSLYLPAEQLLTKTLSHNPQHIDALIGQGILALARHEFKQGLDWGLQAQAISPYRAEVYGIIGDAQIELGRYEDASLTLQKMVDLRPDINSYSRVSYLRELHGDSPGAIIAMKKAVTAGFPTAEETLWAQVQLGHLYFNQGKLLEAEAIYQQILQIQPTYLYAQAGIAKIETAHQRYDKAITTYQQIIDRLPLPEFVIALAELYTITQQSTKAEEQYELVRLLTHLDSTAGMNVDLELALFEAEYGSPETALQKAKLAYQQRPSIYAADVLAWALYKTGNFTEAYRYSQEALRLGTRDAQLHYHAGMIAYDFGKQKVAQQHLSEALKINPHFSLHAALETEVMLANILPKAND